MGILTVRVLMIAAALAGGGAWRYQTEHDPLGQTVHVAEIVPDQARPYVAVRLICGGIAGVLIQINLGQMQGPPQSGEISFTVEGAAAYTTAASLAPITDGVGTYEIKGSEAGNVAHLLMRGDAVTVREGHASQVFSLSGAPAAIGEFIANCSYKI